MASYKPPNHGLRLGINCQCIFSFSVFCSISCITLHVNLYCVPLSLIKYFGLPYSDINLLMACIQDLADRLGTNSKCVNRVAIQENISIQTFTISPPLFFTSKGPA
ncbi:unnamed protein product [Meloidogyne enterolobii]|uniref:Uncharacterized protein n=1 Tax=Meloidogyne enterolobii TaxID=390850 RepID=A0ACB0YZA6_MELEN